MWLCMGISPLLFGLRTWSKRQKTWQVFQSALEKKFFGWGVWVFCEWHHKWRTFKPPWPTLPDHWHAVSPVHFLHHVLRSFVFLIFFSLCLFDVQLLFLNTYQKMINGVVWLDDRHGLSPILYDTAPLFVYTDQLLCHFVFICSNVH